MLHITALLLCLPIIVAKGTESYSSTQKQKYFSFFFYYGGVTRSRDLRMVQSCETNNNANYELTMDSILLREFNPAVQLTKTSLFYYYLYSCNNIQCQCRERNIIGNV